MQVVIASSNTRVKIWIVRILGLEKVSVFPCQPGKGHGWLPVRVTFLDSAMAPSVRAMRRLGSAGRRNLKVLHDVAPLGGLEESYKWRLIVIKNTQAQLQSRAS